MQAIITRQRSLKHLKSIKTKNNITIAGADLASLSSLRSVGFAELAKDNPLERWREFEIRAFRLVAIRA
jgi:hypothetical protein